MEMQGRTALVTGAARRVGRAIALELARGGCDVVVHCRQSIEEAQATAAEIRSLGPSAWVVSADLASVAGVESLLREVAEVAPPVDVLVNSASVYFETTLGDISAETFDSVMAANLRAPFLISQALGVAMKARGNGCIVNITDTSLGRPYKNFTPYLASKAGLAMLTEALALELAPEVRVNSVAPGTVDPPPGASEAWLSTVLKRTPLKRLGAPEDVARMVRFLVEHGDFMTGGHHAVDGGAGVRS